MGSLKRQWPSDGFDEFGPTPKSLGSLSDTNPVLPLQIQLYYQLSDSDLRRTRLLVKNRTIALECTIRAILS
jgi:hypothetical protein